jgi:hypothetical protein
MVESKDLAKRDVPSPNVADASSWRSLLLIRQWISGKRWETAKYLEITVSRKIHAIHFSTLFMHVLFTRF